MKVENDIKLGEAAFHPIYAKSRVDDSLSRANILGLSEKNKTGSLGVTLRKRKENNLFWGQSFKISLKLTKSPTTGWLEQVEEVPKYYVSGENGDRTTYGSAVKNWGIFF